MHRPRIKTGRKKVQLSPFQRRLMSNPPSKQTQEMIMQSIPSVIEQVGYHIHRFF